MHRVEVGLGKSQGGRDFGQNFIGFGQNSTKFDEISSNLYDISTDLTKECLKLRIMMTFGGWRSIGLVEIRF